MIAYVKGELAEVGVGFLVIDIGNVGVNVRISDGFLTELPPVGTQMKIYTYTYVKEDAFLLYGFPSRDDLELFKMLITVNGVGPKGALAILSVMSTTDLRFAIYTGNAKAISKANGVGAKTAERVILDLKDKIHIEDTLSELTQENLALETRTKDAMETNQNRKDAIDALVTLGYGMTEASKAVRQVELTENTTADDILKASLRFLI